MSNLYIELDEGPEMRVEFTEQPSNFEVVLSEVEV